MEKISNITRIVGFMIIIAAFVLYYQWDNRDLTNVLLVLGAIVYAVSIFFRVRAQKEKK